MGVLEKVVTTKEVAKELNLTHVRIRKMVSEGYIPEKFYRKTDRVILIDLKWLEQEKERRKIK